MMRGPAGWLVATLAVALPAHAQERAAEPSDYRMENYRAPVPATLAGARVLSTEQVTALWRAGRVAFVDVMPRPPKPANLPKGTIWRDVPRANIPGSIWLPDTGYGRLAPPTEDYLRRGLARAADGDRARLLVFYCQANCWMSWNAARRALSFGYTNVAWYPEGTDGWQAAGLPLVDAQPESRDAPVASPPG